MRKKKSRRKAEYDKKNTVSKVDTISYCFTSRLFFLCVCIKRVTKKFPTLNFAQLRRFSRERSINDIFLLSRSKNKQPLQNFSNQNYAETNTLKYHFS